MTSVNMWRERRDKTPLKREFVPIPEWAEPQTDGTEKEVGFWVRALTDYEVSHWFQVNEERTKAGLNSDKAWGTSGAYLVGMGLCDENGVNLFPRPQIVQEMKNVPRPVVDRLWNVVARLSGLTVESRNNISGNSNSTQEKDSGTTSPEDLGAEA